MSELRVNINGRECRGYEGQTILEIARENGVEIPTLCHDDRVKMYGSCGVCVVECEGTPKLLRSCSTYAANGMVINTDTKRVRSSRKTALELLLSDHTGDCRPPCVLACPAQTDCQGYVGLIANGEYREAVKLIKDKIPFPASIGRVCPHPCEDACRRKLVEEPISIAFLKQFVGDLDVKGELYTPEVEADTGKRVAVVGGGPGGLTAAYFLRSYGHEVTVYDAMPKMGGMLRYGIPEYRLPKKLLEVECDAIRGMGVEFKNNMKIGRDIQLQHLRDTYDAVIVAVGAWTSTGLRCPGEELEGVFGGIDFLRDVALGGTPFTGRKIAVVGGGNTAMDACRTAVRLGAERVYNIYRRTKAEMPAEEIEILEAEEEGVVFRNLTNPIEVLGEDGKVKAMRLQIMELGEPDASGRRAPVPVEGKEETIEVDTVIVAIGQKLDPAGLEAVEQTKWRTISADESTFRTSLEGVFAVGDATNNGADIAITAIGEAKKAAQVVDGYLQGDEVAYTEPFLVKREMSAEDFADRKKAERAKMAHRPAAQRREDFLEVNLGFSEKQARREAERCLECGCHDYFECKLIDYANQYAVQPEKYDGKVHSRRLEDDHPFIHRNPDKCVLCGLCVRICDEVVGSTALGLVDRGFDTIVKPALDLPLPEAGCIACGQCVAVCPTGALTESQMIHKQVPVRELSTSTTCSFCSVGCRTKVTSTGDMLLRSLPDAGREADALLCMKGRFGFGELDRVERLAAPMLRVEGELIRASYDQAVVRINKKLQALQTQYGPQAVAVAVGERYTNEELLLIKEYAGKALGCENLFSFGKVHSGLSDVTGRDGSTTDFDQLRETGLVVVVESDLMKDHLIAGIRVKQAAQNGARVLVLNSFDSALDEVGQRVDPGSDLKLLEGVAKALLEAGKGEGLAGREELAKALKGAKAGDDAQAVAKALLEAKKAVLVFAQNSVSDDAARLIGDIAALSGHLCGARSGVLQLKPGANSQGLCQLGVQDGEAYREAVAKGALKGLLIFGEDPRDVDLAGLEFLAVQDLYLTETAKKADVVLPAQSFAQVDGSFTNAAGQTRHVNKVVGTKGIRSNFDLLCQLAEVAGAPLPYRSVADLTAALAKLERGEVQVELKPARGGVLAREAASTNALYLNLMEFAAQHGLVEA